MKIMKYSVWWYPKTRGKWLFVAKNHFYNIPGKATVPNEVMIDDGDPIAAGLHVLTAFAELCDQILDHLTIDMTSSSMKK